MTVAVEIASSPQSIDVLRGLAAGQDVYVIASGRSVDGFPKALFRDRFTVGINEVWRDVPCRFLLSHHGETCQEAIDHGQAVVTSDFDCGVTEWGRNVFRGSYFTYHHAEQPHTAGVDLGPIERGLTDTLVTCSSTLASAVHFAAVLGAGAIWLVGADLVSVDGVWNYAGYNANPTAAQLAAKPRYEGWIHDPNSGGTNPNHIRATTPLLMAVVNAVRARGITVGSLSPWVGLTHEGHVIGR